MNIYLSCAPSPVEQNAAAELAEWLGKACNVEFPISTEPEDPSASSGIYIGYTAFADTNRIQAEGGRNALGGVEAWVIRAVGENLVLTGGKKNTDRGIRRQSRESRFHQRGQNVFGSSRVTITKPLDRLSHL